MVSRKSRKARAAKRADLFTQEERDKRRFDAEEKKGELTPEEKWDQIGWRQCVASGDYDGYIHHESKVERDRKWYLEVIKHAAQHNQLEIIDHILDKKAPKAERRDYYRRDDRYMYINMIMFGAAYSDNLKLATEYYDESSQIDHMRVVMICIQRSSKKVLAYLLSKKRYVTPRVCSLVATNRDITVLNLVRQIFDEQKTKFDWKSFGRSLAKQKHTNKNRMIEIAQQAKTVAKRNANPTNDPNNLANTEANFPPLG